MHEIGPRLDAQGVRPRHARHWSCSTVAVILRNEAYIGKAAYLKSMSSGKRTRHNRTGRQKGGAVRRLIGRTARAREEWIELPVPAVVDEALFARAQQQRAANQRFSEASPWAAISTQDYRADASPGALCLRALWVHHGTELRDGKPRGTAPTLLSALQ